MDRKKTVLKVLFPPKLEGAQPSLQAYDLSDDTTVNYSLQSLLAHESVPVVVQVQGTIRHQDKLNIYATLTIFPNDINYQQESQKTGLHTVK